MELDMELQAPANTTGISLAKTEISSHLPCSRSSEHVILLNCNGTELKLIGPRKTCSCNEAMLRKALWAHLTNIVQGLFQLAPFFCCFNRHSYVQRGVWFSNCRQATHVWHVNAHTHTHAQEILKINASHSYFDRTAHMDRQEIYHSVGNSDFNKNEGKKWYSVTPVQRNTEINLQAGYKRDLLYPACCCPWICVSMCVSVCQEFLMISCCPSRR